jgi:hypothetical protein
MKKIDIKHFNEVRQSIVYPTMPRKPETYIWQNDYKTASEYYQALSVAHLEYQRLSKRYEELLEERLIDEEELDKVFKDLCIAELLTHEIPDELKDAVWLVAKESDDFFDYSKVYDAMKIQAGIANEVFEAGRTFKTKENGS